MNRRAFLAWLGGTAAGVAAAHTLDLDKLLWVPGEKTIFLPTESNALFVTVSEVTRELARLLRPRLPVAPRFALAQLGDVANIGIPVVMNHGLAVSVHKRFPFTSADIRQMADLMVETLGSRKVYAYGTPRLMPHVEQCARVHDLRGGFSLRGSQSYNILTDRDDTYFDILVATA